MSKDVKDFIIDVAVLTQSQKAAVWSKFWRPSNNSAREKLNISMYDFSSDEYFHVFKKSTFPGNIARSNGGGCGQEDKSVPLVKPLLKQVTVDICEGIDAPRTITVAGVKYIRA